MFVCFVVVSHFIFLVFFQLPPVYPVLVAPCPPLFLSILFYCFVLPCQPFLLLSSFRAFRLPRSFGWQCLKSFLQPSFPAPGTFLFVPFLFLSAIEYQTGGRSQHFFTAFLKFLLPHIAQDKTSDQADTHKDQAHKNNRIHQHFK